MTDTLKVLGQNTPSANTATSLYTVPSATSAVARCIVCNTNSADVKIRLWVQIAGASDTTKQYFFYDITLQANQTLETMPIALATTDVIRVQADTTNVAFSAYGIEVT